MTNGVTCTGAGGQPSASLQTEAAISAIDVALPDKLQAAAFDWTLLYGLRARGQELLGRLHDASLILRTDRAALAPEDAALLAATERSSAHIAAWAHLVVVVIIAGVVLVAFRNEHHNDPVVTGLLLADVAASLGGLLFARHRYIGGWLAWAAGLLDVGVLIGVVVQAISFQATLPGPFKPSLVGIWGVFLSLSLSAMRGRPMLLLVQTTLFTLGLGYVATALASEVTASTADPFGSVSIFFNPAQSVIRVSVIALVGAMLVITTLRGRINLRNAIVASRRAANLSRYMAPSVASIVADADVAALREGRHQNVAVLFADVRDFTLLAETMRPHEIAAFLTTFRRRAVAAIENEGGVIDKFVGDEVMGLFGVPAASSRDAGRAIRAASALLASVQAWSLERTAKGLSPIHVGIGINYGPVFAGALGEDRLEFTVIGSTVNVARRLEELTKTLDCDCIISSWAVHAARADPAGGWSCRGLPAQTIRGHSEPVGAFALVTDHVERKAAAQP